MGTLCIRLPLSLTFHKARVLKRTAEPMILFGDCLNFRHLKKKGILLSLNTMLILFQTYLRSHNSKNHYVEINKAGQCHRIFPVLIFVGLCGLKHITGCSTSTGVAAQKLTYWTVPYFGQVCYLSKLMPPFKESMILYTVNFGSLLYHYLFSLLGKKRTLDTFMKKKRKEKRWEEKLELNLSLNILTTEGKSWTIFFHP